MLSFSKKWILWCVFVCNFELLAFLVVNCDDHDVVHSYLENSTNHEPSTSSIKDTLTPDIHAKKLNINDGYEQNVNCNTIKLIKGSGVKNDKLKEGRWILMEPETVALAGEDETTQHLVERNPPLGNMLWHPGSIADDETVPFSTTYGNKGDVPPELLKMIEEAQQSNGPIHREGFTQSNGQPIKYTFEASRLPQPQPQPYRWESSGPPKTYQWESSEPPKTYQWQSSQSQVPSPSDQNFQKEPLLPEKVTSETRTPPAWIQKTTTTTSTTPRKEGATSYSESLDDDDDDMGEPGFSEEKSFSETSAGGSSPSGAKSVKTKKSSSSSSKSSWATKSGVTSGSSGTPKNQLMAIKRVRVTRYHKGSKAASKAVANSSARAKRMASKSRSASCSRGGSRRSVRSGSRSGSSAGKRSPRRSPRRRRKK